MHTMLTKGGNTIHKVAYEDPWGYYAKCGVAGDKLTQEMLPIGNLSRRSNMPQVTSKANPRRRSVTSAGKSRIMKAAARYRRAGQSASAAMKRAWREKG